MRNIKMIIEYDGSRYLGWQRQRNSSENTIQGKLENVISLMVGEETEIVGSGRTDAGVHAYAQVANFKTNVSVKLSEMHEYLNHYLPTDIVVKELEEAEERFHARYNASGKKYVYRIWNDPIPSAFERKYSYHIPQRLDTPAMKAASSKLLGTHDFLPFSSLKKSKKSTVRTIRDIGFVQNRQLLEISFVGNGFLYNMVRIVSGTLIEIGLGVNSADHIHEIFEAGVREEAGFTAPAQGLFLKEVYYS